MPSLDEHVPRIVSSELVRFGANLHNITIDNSEGYLASPTSLGKIIQRVYNDE